MNKYIGFCLLSLVALAGCFSNNGGVDELIEIGVLLPLSGDVAAYGEEAKSVLEFQVKDYENVKLLFEDGKCDGEAANSAIEKLRYEDNIRYVLGGLCSNETLAIAKQLEYLGMLAISGTSSNPDIEGASANQFSLSYKDSDVGDDLVSKLKVYDKVAIFSEENDFNIGLKNELENGLSEDVIVFNETFKSSSKDFRDALLNIKELNPDAIFLNPFIGDNASLLLTQIDEIGGLGDADLYGQTAFVPSELLVEKGDVIEGMIIIDAPSIYGAEADAFIESLEEAGISYDKLGDYYTAAFVDALNILIEVAKEKDVEASIEKLRSKTFDGLISDELSFGDKSFVQGVGIGEFKVKNRVLERM